MVHRETNRAQCVLQWTLVRVIESWFGERSAGAVQIGRPTFEGGRPQIFFAPDGSQVCAQLSEASGGNWSAAMYELAHETVHLLDPEDGFTNWFEEGVATAAAQECHSIRFESSEPPPLPGDYQTAHEMVLNLGQEWRAIARDVRDQCGTMRGATFEVLQQLCPETPPGTLQRLIGQLEPQL